MRVKKFAIFAFYLISTLVLAQDTDVSDLELFEFVAEFANQSNSEEWVDPTQMFELEELASTDAKKEPEE